MTPTTTPAWKRLCALRQKLYSKLPVYERFISKRCSKSRYGGQLCW